MGISTLAISSHYSYTVIFHNTHAYIIIFVTLQITDTPRRPIYGCLTLHQFTKHRLSRNYYIYHPKLTEGGRGRGLVEKGKGEVGRGRGKGIG